LPTPPTASLSSRPNADDGDHDRVAPRPVTPWQPDSWMLTGGKFCSPAANSSRTEPADEAGQSCPGGSAGSAQSAATMACTWVAPLSVTWRGEAVRLTSTRSALRPSAHSDPPAGVLAAAACAPDELAVAEAGCPAPPAETLAPWDITPAHLRALRTLSRHGTMRLSELSERLEIAPRTATEVVDALESRDLVRRRADPGDRRATLVEVTEPGAGVLAQIRAAGGIRGTEAGRIFGRLTPADRAELARILGKLRD
jgi:DNA-binding MarR family transcriptional regulator